VVHNGNWELRAMRDELQQIEQKENYLNAWKATTNQLGCIHRQVTERRNARETVNDVNGEQLTLCWWSRARQEII
jgi:hypothetical protein